MDSTTREAHIFGDLWGGQEGGRIPEAEVCDNSCVQCWIY